MSSNDVNAIDEQLLMLYTKKCLYFCIVSYGVGEGVFKLLI